MSFQFKPVVLGSEGKKHKQLDRWRHVVKTLAYMIIGALVSLLMHYFVEGWTLSILLTDEINNPLFTGAFVGFFLTNSPCARGRC
jgi:hypothetical protein